MGPKLTNILRELKHHAPFTVTGTLTGIAIMAIVAYGHVPEKFSHAAFWLCHPAHVGLSAITTAAMYRLHAKRGFWSTLLVGYVGAVGIGTLSDCIIPYVGEFLLNLPRKAPHIGFIEMWYVVNPIAILGVVIACKWPHTKLPHAGHVLLSTWASLFHMTMAVGDAISPLALLLVAAFLFLAVWLPCCTSDIVFPLLFTRGRVDPAVLHHD